MREQTVKLEKMPTMTEIISVLDICRKRCACTKEQKRTNGQPEERPEGVTRVLCKPCGARELWNNFKSFVGTL